MEDFFYAGGLRALMAEIADLLHLDSPTMNGRTIGENLAGVQAVNADVIRPRERPLSLTGGTSISTEAWLPMVR
jgi:dihydroxyacid dehydratase/phosphogluconate dehydratase